MIIMQTKFNLCWFLFIFLSSFNSSRIEDFINSDDEDKLTLDRCNAFMRRLIHQEVRIRWPNEVRLESRNDNGNQYIIAHKMGTKEEEELIEAEKREKERLEVQQAVGLSALLRKIADSVSIDFWLSFHKWNYYC